MTAVSSVNYQFKLFVAPTVGLLVKSQIRKIPPATIAVLAVEERVKALGSSCPPCSVLIHQLTITHYTMSLFAKHKVTHIAKMSNGACSPYRVVCRLERAICREDVQLESALGHEGDPEFLTKCGPVDCLPKARASCGLVLLFCSTDDSLSTEEMALRV
jgi:hypothetical protein